MPSTKKVTDCKFVTFAALVESAELHPAVSPKAKTNVVERAIAVIGFMDFSLTKLDKGQIIVGQTPVFGKINVTKKSGARLCLN